MKRRSFLHTGIKALPSIALLPMILQSCKKELTNIDQQFNGKVIIIGAGIAGLHAAMLLESYGCEVEIMEASDRVGGRILSLENFADFPVELGAESIDGKRNILNDFATAKGFKLSTNENQDYFRLYNQTRSEEETEENSQLTFLKQIIESLGTYSSNDNSVADYLLRIGTDPFINNISEAMIGNTYGTSNSRLSIKGLATDEAQWTSGSEHYYFQDRSFFAFMNTAYAGQIEKVFLNKQVTEIDYSGNSSQKIVVKTVEGESYFGDRVLVTVPISILKSGIINFSPPLPLSKTFALDSLEMDEGIKVILKFNQQFWPDDMASIIGGTIIPEYWVSKGIKESNDYLLTAFVTGEKAENVALLGNAAIDGILGELNQLFSTNLATAAFINSYIKKWKEDQFIQGAYSYTKSGQTNQRRNLAEPINNRCFFAGEAANYTGHAATVHGAMESAFDNSKLILTSPEND